MPSAPDPGRSRPVACLNCGSPRVAAFCPDCGQQNLDVRVPARALVVDALEDGLSLDSRIGRTAGPFLFRPGFLTAEWSAGRRARYSSPLRMYLLASALFFVAAGIAGDGGPRLVTGGRDDAALAEARKDIEEADVPEEVKAAVREGRPVPRVPQGTEEQHRGLRSRGFLGRAVDDRWQALARMPPEELQARAGAAIREWVPRVMFFLVPAAVAILALLWPRRWLSEHVVLSLHLHAFAFTVLTVLVAVRLLPWAVPREALATLLGLAVPAHVVLAMRRVYGQGWGATLAKGTFAGLLYVLALGVGLAGVGILALWFA